MAEVNLGVGDGDGNRKEWLCDSGADYHMSGDITLFDNKHSIKLLRQTNKRESFHRSVGSSPFFYRQSEWGKGKNGASHGAIYVQHASPRMRVRHLLAPDKEQGGVVLSSIVP